MTPVTIIDWIKGKPVTKSNETKCYSNSNSICVVLLVKPCSIARAGVYKATPIYKN